MLTNTIGIMVSGSFMGGGGGGGAGATGIIVIDYAELT